MDPSERLGRPCLNGPDGDDIWNVVLDLPHGFSGHYTFTNGACQDWSCKEYIGGQDCADPDHWNDRYLDNVTSSFTVSTCFSQCSTDGTCAAVSGCTDPSAINHFDAATEDDGSCVYMNESTLPLVQITTDTPILDDPRIVANMKVTNLPGGLNTLADEPNEYNGQITIEIRGSSSQFFPKQSYALETQDSTGANNNVPLMGMPAENDWILHGPYSDKTLMRNAVIYEMGTAIGQYTTRRRYCELYINGDYRGVYMFMENIKRDENRVDIATLLPTDTAGNEVTGGYIMKVDRIQGDYEGGWNSPYPKLGGETQPIQMHKPEADDLHPLQLAYIEDHFTAFEHALARPNFADPVLGYAPYIDAESFVETYFANEITKNVDAYRLSQYFYKEKDSDGGKIVMGPWWDFNLGFGNSDGCDSYNTNGFESNTGCRVLHPFWFERLREDPDYRGLTRCMWDAYRADVWSDEAIDAMIDSLAGVLAVPRCATTPVGRALASTCGPTCSLARPTTRKCTSCAIGSTTAWRGSTPTSKAIACSVAPTPKRATTNQTPSTTTEAASPVAALKTSTTMASSRCRTSWRRCRNSDALQVARPMWTGTAKSP